MTLLRKSLVSIFKSMLLLDVNVYLYTFTLVFLFLLCIYSMCMSLVFFCKFLLITLFYHGCCRCSTYQSGDLTKSDRAIDGIFGFGQHGLSVVSQLSSRGITPRSFSHCLKGEGNGGGILVLGEILDPSIVYSPLVPSQ